MRAGAHDYIMKNNLTRLAPAVEREVREARERRERRAMEALARRAERLASLGTLAGSIAHEINNPIGVMTSRLEVMLLEGEQSLPEPVREDLRVLLHHAQRVARIAQGLLALARKSSPTRAAVDLTAVVRSIAALVETPFAKHGVALALTLSPVAPIEGDASALE